MSKVTLILNAMEQGDSQAADQLLPAVYEELRLLAAQKLSHERPGQTLQATALVHEAYLRLVGDGPQSWENRGHFFAAAAEAMRRILVDNARRKKSVKRGGDSRRVSLNDAALLVETNIPAEELLALDEALQRLAEKDKIKADLVRLRFFAGLTGEQAAKALGISSSTADDYWAYTRAWLCLEMGKDTDPARP
jgi:RNA polymerase sigma factor (TIGR02999 family)